MNRALESLLNFSGAAHDTAGDDLALPNQVLTTVDTSDAPGIWMKNPL